MRNCTPKHRSFNQRFGHTSASRAACDITPTELRVVVAVMACERSMGAYPTRAAILKVSGCKSANLPSELTALDWLEFAGWVGRHSLYRATERAWRELGFSRGEDAAAE
ncbi:hypothetical protein [Caudoviricetes sp.]|nr:hypothetical protein [Caudoviricetes sp.]